MKEKELRQAAIRSLTDEYKIKTQEEMIQRLKERGIGATQATLSRDIVDLKLVKTDESYYTYEGELQFARLANEFVTEVISACNIVLVKCSEGAASGVAATFDRLGWREVLGSVAGDDTILLVTPTADTAKSIEVRIAGLISK
ncbi:MAG: ArgR family transcriptional regulator [Actinomycetota bacterium]|nr:ArgR family transcriptional regulator [Actinomycetota bacterium]